MKNKKQLSQLFLLGIYFLIIYVFFWDIINAKTIVLDLSFKTIDFSKEDPKLWPKILSFFHFSNAFLFGIFLINYLKNEISIIIKERSVKEKSKKIDTFKSKKIDFKKMTEEEIKKYIKNKNKIRVNIGFNDEKKLRWIEEKALFQNILITGSIGSGKTQSAVIPLTKQIVEYKSENENKKIAGLILDVKGNFCKSVEEICKESGRLGDLIKIELEGKYKYNPLHKPELKPQVLAHRLKTILTLLSSETSEMYWLDKAEQLIAETIKFIRLYNNGYVNFVELSKVIFDPNFYQEKKNEIRKKLISKKFTKEEIFNLNSFLEYYENEFLNLDDRTSAIIKSEISRITNIFVSDYQVNKTFSPSIEEINFHGFKEVLEKGKIVVLNMNLSENTVLAKIIAIYLKLDFQGEVLSQLKSGRKNYRTSTFICDEYQEYVTKTDANFYAQSREARCINIVSTQSYTSLKNTLKEKESCEVIIQNLINKIWFRNDDKYTVDSAISQIGKVYKENISRTISENSKDTEYNYLLKTFVSSNSNLSESINKSKKLENLFEVKDFTQKLKMFEAIIFFSNNEKEKIIPEKIITIPNFKRKEKNVK